MLTRCPQCATTFRVSPQQLKVHQGEVRCGRCSTVFDAFESLVPEPASSQAPAEAEAAPPAPPPKAAPATLPPAGALPATTTVPPPKEIVAPPPGELPDARSETRKAAKDASDKLAAKLSMPTLSGRRWPWIVLAVVALLVLAAQATYHYRADLAVLWPDARPILERACATLKCTVSLPRRVEQISIEASDLQVDTGHANLMLLTATLKNRAGFAQEYPSLALTLTDAQDQPLARRVLTPADYLDKKIDNGSGFGANADLALKVFIDSREIKATGYRLFLFYS